MAYQRAIFTVTCDDSGRGEDDVSLKLPSTLTRHAVLDKVTIDISAATALQVPSVSLSELNDVTDIDVPVTAESTDVGRQLFYIDAKDQVLDEYNPRYETVDVTGARQTTPTYGSRPVIRTKQVRCLITNGSPSGVYTVNMYYETAGDYRF